MKRRQHFQIPLIRSVISDIKFRERHHKKRKWQANIPDDYRWKKFQQKIKETKFYGI